MVVVIVDEVSFNEVSHTRGIYRVFPVGVRELVVVVMVVGVDGVIGSFAIFPLHSWYDLLYN